MKGCTIANYVARVICMIQLIIHVAMNEVNVISCMGALKRDQIKYIQLATWAIPSCMLCHYL